MDTIHRRPVGISQLGLTAALNTTPDVDTQRLSECAIGIPAASSITSLTFYGSLSKGGTYYALYDDAGAAVARTVAAGKGYPFPAACASWLWLKIVVDHAGPVDISAKG